MLRIICPFAALCLSGSIGSAAEHPALTAATSPHHPTANVSDQSVRLDGIVVHGRIRARGIFGLISVPGTLAFRDGMLHWTVDGSTDSARYETSEASSTIEFTAGYLTEDNEMVRWRGDSDGHSVTNVVVHWTREEGESRVHDLLLPKVVVLEFTPDR